jgi:hypothetical protein
MATKTESRYGQCPTHGQVSGTREVPGPSFPFLVYAVRRARARREPFRCPECGSPVEPSD